MINNELAKDLKDAGFPLKKAKDYNMEECPFVWGQFKHDDGEIYLFPALSELIEACDDKVNLFCLNQIHSKGWQALISYGVEKPPEIGFGSTPEEAVARLWLALNRPIDYPVDK